ncbi:MULTISPECIES: carboxylating nicotinate-nucleotide diphosphorylase [Roseovarius]|jgi:nicotinate-nucleotide pyrophosphorylase (carboxylating)|uniref:Probable nicotinate-nucleotide pyrophosphorylase [carboxylating] n=4 Tax=Roseovarius nubinhibens TaxID=314263 RepID=A3SNY0_ROSNI|nr:carboxylating nicotinate-nucleotide diphosphorylase [Roseovarius nubinhibens]EAP76170.1 Nicotinate-nucleotide pyrophosphorylase [Roseovarius nubinhibens ISM]MAO28416.1 nicotinate-nucleotide diphosphorylase (carboxylating) [Roseovarius sp.]MBU3001624.1 carboxylating nicotinate-nucleotide diphosphorylase [Roseovarius nubinhibens]|tara:strand:+ start:10808 stop:11644 length:837 start_codon:yes stop_codon:yes gene_type:complete
MLLDLRKINQLIDLWLDEDVNYYDLTAKIMVDDDAVAKFGMNAREPITLSGIKIAEMIFRKMDPECTFESKRRDGDKIDTGETFAVITGNAQALLTAERVALNLVQRMCGIAGLTAQYVQEIEGTKAILLDSRKTTPGLRMLEKYAVTCGGGRSHRLGLDNGIMLKDNHIAVAGGIRAAVERAKAYAPMLTKIEVECDRLDQVDEALAAGVDVIMLDNMSNDDMREAVKIVGGRIPLECSGGVRLDTIRGKAETGVDYVSVGRITQSATCVDIGLDDV